MHLVGCFEPGDHILKHAGASAVSIAGIQFSKAAGANKIFVPTGSDDKIEYCKSLGATHGFDYHTEDWVKAVLNATEGHGADAIVDSIGKNYAQGNFEAVAMDGRIVQLASLSGYELDGLDISLLENKHLRWEGGRLRSRPLEYQGKSKMRCQNSRMGLFRSRSRKLSRGRIFRRRMR